jgi:hypothetical protein
LSSRPERSVVERSAVLLPNNKTLVRATAVQYGTTAIKRP